MKTRIKTAVKNRIKKFLFEHIDHYSHEKYWEMRAEAVNKDSKKSKLLRYWYLYKIRKSDAFNNAYLRAHLGCGAQFATPPVLPHETKGIFISADSVIGKNCTIYQQVTLVFKRSGSKTGSPVIGDNCILGAGCKIIGKVTVGNNAVIGANAVVTCDIPENAVAVGVPAKVVRLNKPETA